jgi:ADP-ribose pyrophosphatase
VDDESRRGRYDRLRRTNPELFANPPDGVVDILFQPADVAAAEAAAAGALADAGLPRSWARTGVVFEDQFDLAIRDAVRMPDGRLGTYLRRISPGNAPGVVMLPRLGPDVLLVRHFRHATRRWHLELPRGFGTPGRSPAEDARRELREEIGAVAGPLIDLGVIYPDTGISATAVQLYYTEITSYQESGEAGADEGIAGVALVTPERLAELIGSGEITDGFTINAYARAVLRGHLPR